jgi:hypothetical protein
MKKFMIFFSILTLLIVVSGCSDKDDTTEPSNSKTKVSEWSGTFTGDVENGTLDFILYSDNSITLSWDTPTACCNSSAGSYTQNGTNFNFTVSGRATAGSEFSKFTMSGSGTLNVNSGNGSYSITFNGQGWEDQAGNWNVTGYYMNYDLHFSSLNQMNEARCGFGYAYDGNNIYSVCGRTDISPYRSKTIERYDLANNNWSVFANDLIPRIYCSAEYIPSQNNIYVFNGETYDDNSYTDTIEIINAHSGLISYNASNPYPVEYGGSAVWNDKIYVFGGSNSAGFSNRLYEFDPTGNSWKRLPDMPEAKQTNGEIIKGILYVIGGYNGSESKRIDAYDIQNSSWVNLGELPVGISAHSMTASGNNIWIVGSYNDIYMVGIYNTEIKEFTQLNTDIIGRRHCGICIEGPNLFVYGGNQPSGSILKNMQKADISGYISSIDN